MKIRSLAVAGVMAASMAMVGIGTAHAGVIPAPSPSVTPSISPNFGGLPSSRPTPAPIRRVPLRPEAFNLVITSTGLNAVHATGPVNGTGTDSSVSDTFDRFNLPNTANRVNVLHTGTAMPTLNFRTCEASLVQHGAWAFAGGTGVNLHATGHGVFTLVELAHFPSLRGQCELRFVRGNALTQNRINPDFVGVVVHGTGVAAR